MSYQDNTKYAKYRCNFCNIDIRWYSVREYLESEQRWWECPQCGTVFITKRNFRRHRLQWMIIVDNEDRAVLLDLKDGHTMVYVGEGKPSIYFNYLIENITPTNIGNKIRTLLVFS